MASVGGGDSKSSSDFNEYVWNQGAMNDLYGNAEGLWQNRDNTQLYNQGNQAVDYANQIAGGAAGGWNNQLSGGFYDQDLRNSLMNSMNGPSQTGQLYESIIGGAGNEYIQPMVDASNQAHQDQYDRYGAPNMDMAAEAAGQSGSARHGVNQFLGQNETNKNKINAEMALRGNAYDKDTALKLGIAQAADQGRHQSQQLAFDMMNSQNQNQQGAINYGQNMQNIGAGGMDLQQQLGNIDWDQLMQYANVIGGPTILGSGSSRGSGKEAKVGVGKGA